MMIRCFLSIFMVCILFSCGQSKRGSDIKMIMTEWQGKEITIPDILVYKILGRDTLCSDLWNKPFRIFTYIDSVGCTGCRFRLSEWKMLVDSCRQQSLDVSFIFVVHSSNFKHFTIDVKNHHFDEPIVYDYKNQFHRLNRFPPEPYRTFLLDNQNRVQIIGNPVETPQLWELYKAVITQSQ